MAKTRKLRGNFNVGGCLPVTFHRYRRGKFEGRIRGEVNGWAVRWVVREICYVNRFGWSV